jgi:4-hydroxyphenylpyruvate dioxygenase
VYKKNLLGVSYDFVEYYVGMAKMVVYWHVHALGFEVRAYCGPETGHPEKHSYYLVKNDIKIVITSASQPSSFKIVSFVDLHGNGVKKIGIKVQNVNEHFNNALIKGGIPISLPKTIADEAGSVDLASLKLFDDNEIILVDYKDYQGDFIPGFVNVKKEWTTSTNDSGLSKIDHIACALRVNEINLWEGYFNSVLNSKTVTCFDERQKDGDSKIGMLLKVLQSDDKRINNVLVEPDQRKKTQIQLFIDEHYGSGIQHIAFESSDIFKTVESLRKNGVRFTPYPDSYYANLKEKYPKLNVEKLQKYGIICDVIGNSLLFQVFTLPIGDRTTFFYEIIQRVHNYEGFGLGNIRALFDALEGEIKK